ncbi:MAG TPA: immunoglobulin domain-containing protein [Verrucomicrobiae bacterium]
MKTKNNSLQKFKALFVAGLVAGPMLAFNALAIDNVWAPADAVSNPDGSQYAYFNDPNNWSLAEVPTYTDPNSGQTERVVINGTLGTTGVYVSCIVTNDTGDLYQLIMGDDGTAGGGEMIVTNGASASFGVASGQWTGVGFPNGPSTLYIGPGCSFTCGSHLWVGQGTNNGNPAVGTVIVDGGSLYIPNGQLGVGWNGDGGTNELIVTNGGSVYLQQWASATLGEPGNPSLGILNIADYKSKIVITNVYANDFTQLETNDQLLAYGGQGTIVVTANPVSATTTLGAIAPTNATTPFFSDQPSNAIVSLGGTVSFNALVSNVAANYQWLFDGNPLTDGNGISGSRTATLTIAGVTAAEVGVYSVVATNSSVPAQFTTSHQVSLNSTGINLYPVITILGVPGNTYVTSYATTLNGTYVPLATNTITSFAPFYLVDTNTPLAVTRFYTTQQQ